MILQRTKRLKVLNSGTVNLHDEMTTRPSEVGISSPSKINLHPSSDLRVKDSVGLKRLRIRLPLYNRRSSETEKNKDLRRQDTEEIFR